MRAVEFLVEDDDLASLADACSSWIELWKPNEQINIILAHPFSQKFKSSSASEIYRSIFVSEEKFNKTNKISLRPRTGILPFSENPNWGGSARDDFNYNGDILKFKKSFKSADLVLNFSALVKELVQLGQRIYAPNESELWMKATPYYKTFVRDELINIDKG